MKNDTSLAIERKKTRSWLIVLGVLAFVVLIALVKGAVEKRGWLYTEAVTAQLEESRAAGSPVVVYFHSPDCSSCKVVQASLDAVYPGFEDTVKLLDVDVTNLRYRDLVNQVGVQTAPTLLLVNMAGEEKLIVGEISPQDLQIELAALAGGAP